MSDEELKKVANEVRKGIVTGVHAAKSGHPGGSLGAADIMTYLYFEEMNVDPAEMCIRDSIEAQTFSVDLPEYWDGRVTAEVDGDVIGLYSTAFPDKELGYLAMKNEPYGNAGDIECGLSLIHI